MDITYDVVIDVAGLTDALVAAGLAQGARFHGVSGSETQTVVHLADDATQSELDIVESTVQGYDPLPFARGAALARLDAECRSYIYEHYDAARQSSLNAMLTQAALLGYTNRAAYIGGALMWVESVIGYYYEKKDELEVAESVEALETVTWDFPSFNASDPGITLRDAQNMTN